MLSDAHVLVDPGRLGPVGAQIGRGGQATVHLLPEFRLPDSPGPQVYKRYRKPIPRTEGVLDLIGFRNALTGPARSWLDGLALWPVRAVVDDGLLLGVVMPRIDDGFMHDIVMDSRGGLTREPREAQWLMADPRRMATYTLNPPASTTDRAGVCRDLAEVLRVLHHSGIVYGDISPKNALWRLDRLPNLQVLDCDGALSSATRTEVRQLNTPDWTPPEGGRLSQETDCYKLGLFVLRVLAPERGKTASRDPERARPALGDAGTAMLAAALGADPAGRPTAAEWVRHLVSMAPVAPPVIRSVSLREDVVVRGAPTVVHWDAPTAAEIEVVVLDVEPFRLPGSTTSLTVGPMRSGPIRVVARNRFGEVVRDSAPVIVLDPPMARAPAVPVPSGGTGGGAVGPPLPAAAVGSVPAVPVPSPLPDGVTPDPALPPFPGPGLPAPTPVPWPNALPDPSILIGAGVLEGGDPR